MVSYFDIGRANYSRIEKGEIFPGAPILLTLRKEFDVSLGWLIANEGPMFQRDGVSGDQQNRLHSEGHGQEIGDLLLHLERVPMLKHAVLAFFLEYKEKNKEHISRIMRQEKSDSLGGAK